MMPGFFLNPIKKLKRHIARKARAQSVFSDPLKIEPYAAGRQSRIIHS
jgi:hypothetical protein